MQWLYRETPADYLAGYLRGMSGEPLNVSAVARRMGVTRPTARARLRKLVLEDLVFLLPSLNRGRPLLYVKRTFQGRWSSIIIQRIRESRPDASFFWWKTGRVRRIGLISQLDGKSVGIQISEDFIGNKTWWPLLIARQRGVIQRGYVLHNEPRAFGIRKDIFGLPLFLFTAQAEEWMFHRETTQEVMAAITRFNRKPPFL